MFHIARVEIEGIWGNLKAVVDFHPDVNIFIGRNGSGKTTFMDLLYGVLKVDLRILALHEFSSILLRLTDGTHTRTIRVTRERRDEPVELLRFQVGNRAFKLPFYSAELDSARHIRVRPRLEAMYEELKEKISTLVNVASLSVHRSAYEPVPDADYPPRRRLSRPPIDERLEELLRQLTTYQLQLAEEIANISSQFQRDVLTSILFDPQFDTWTLSGAETADLASQREELTRAYRELGALSNTVAKRIATHFAAIEKSINAIKDEKQAKTVDDVLPLPLLRRSQHIIKLLSEAEIKKQKVNRPINSYLRALEAFIGDKKLRISTRGDLVISKGDLVLPVPTLSSGEKQLVVLLTEALLQRNQPFVFLADEPELSLHIEWQEKIIGSLRALNPQAQVVVATHSPEITAGWKNSLFDMAEVVRG